MEPYMPSDLVERLLAADFAASRAALENDEFTDRLTRRFSTLRRKRALSIGAASVAGGVFAASQFDAMAKLFEPLAPIIAAASASGEIGSVSPQILAAAAIAISIAATGLIMQSER
jgi:hypothetical protein